MCILCLIQRWSRKVATMLPWLVIPLIGLWALSQLLPPAFRFEVTSPRLACVVVLLVTLFWYEFLMPQLSVWQVRRNARLREVKRFEAIEMQKLRKIATRRCRNCLTPYRDQNPGGGKFMCSYCGHISKRPVLDLPGPPGMGNPGVLKDLVGKGGKILNGKVWSDNGWTYGQDWLENGNWGDGALAGKSSYWKNGGGIFGGEDQCCAEKSYSCIFMFACRAITTFWLSVMWLWRKIFRLGSSSNDALADGERRGMSDKRSENGVTGLESRGEKARRKAEEKRQARLERELLEEEERKQREEVARLVEERRRLRDEKVEAEKESGKVSPRAKERDSKREAERKRQLKKKERDKCSSKSNSDAEELEKRAGKDNVKSKKSESDMREQQRTAPESAKTHSTEGGYGFKVATANQNRSIAGTRYLDRMRGTFLSSSRAFTGGGFSGKSTSTTSVSREHKPNTMVDQAQTSTFRKDTVQPEWVSGRSNVNGDEKNMSRPVFVEPQPCVAPKKSWQQLFTRSPAISPPSNLNVISRPHANHQSNVQSPRFSNQPAPTQSFNNPINFGLPSPFTLPWFPFGSTSNSSGLPLTSEPMFPRTPEAPHQFLPEESEIFEDPCYVPDPASLLGPVSESLEHFQRDLGFVTDSALEPRRAVKTKAAPSEVTRPSPIESPSSRLRVSEERHASSYLFPSTPKAQDNCNNVNDTLGWQMWNTSPRGQCGLGVVGGPVSWHLPSQMNMPNMEDVHSVPKKTMASLFKKDEKVISGSHLSQNILPGNGESAGAFNNSIPASVDGQWLPKNLFGSTSGNDNQILRKPVEEAAQNGLVDGNPNLQFEMSAANSRATKEWNVQGSKDGIGGSPVARPHIGGLYLSPDVQSLWSFN